MPDATPVTQENGYPSKYVVCSESYYHSLGNNIDYSALYIVNTGSEPSSEDNDYTELYYGKNKLTDVQIFTNPINDNTVADIPNNKIILSVQESDIINLNGNGTTQYEFRDLKFKYNDQLLSITSLGLGVKAVSKVNNTLVVEVGPGAAEESAQGKLYIPVLTEMPANQSTSYYLNASGTFTQVSGGGGGTTYHDGNGISIDGSNNINVLLNTTTGLGFDTNNKIQIKLKSGGQLAFDPSTGELYCTASGGGSGTTYSAGDGITINSSNAISVNRKSSNSYLEFVDHQIGVDVSSLATYLASNSTFISSVVSSVIPNLDDGRIVE